MKEKLVKLLVICLMTLSATSLRAGFQHGTATTDSGNTKTDKQAPSGQSDVLVTINGQPLRSTALFAAMNGGDAVVRQSVLADTIDEELLFKHAFDAAWDAGRVLPTTLSYPERFKLIQSDIERIQSTVASVTELEARQHYERNPLLYAERKLYKLTAAFIARGDALDRVPVEQWLHLRDWQAFEALTKQHKLSARFQRFNLPSEALPEMQLASIRSAGVGAMRLIRQDQYWILLSIDDMLPAELTWGQARSQIREQLLHKRQLVATVEHLVKLRSKARIHCVEALQCEQLAPSSWPQKLAPLREGPFMLSLKALAKLTRKDPKARWGGPAQWEALNTDSLDMEQRDAAFRLFGTSQPWQIIKNKKADGGIEYVMNLEPLSYQRDLSFTSTARSSPVQMSANYDRSGKKGIVRTQVPIVQGQDDLFGTYSLEGVKYLSKQSEGVGGIWFGTTDIEAKKFEVKTERGVFAIASPRFDFDLLQNGQFADLAMALSAQSVSFGDETVGPLSMSWSINKLNAAATAELLQGMASVEESSDKRVQDAQISGLVSRVGPDVLTSQTVFKLNQFLVNYGGYTASLTGFVKLADPADFKLMSADTWKSHLYGRFKLVVPLGWAKAVMAAFVRMQVRSGNLMPDQVEQAQKGAWEAFVQKVNQKRLVRWTQDAMQTDFEISKGKFLINGVDYQSLVASPE